MDPETQARWIEVQFVQICNDILKYNNDPLDIMDIIDALAKFGHYNPEPLKELTQRVLSSYRIKPTKEEFILLCRCFNVPVKTIKEKTGVHNKTLYNLINDAEENPRAFYPKFNPQQVALLKQFVDTFTNFRKAGVFND